MQGCYLNWVCRQRLPHDETSARPRKDNRWFLGSSQDKNNHPIGISATNFDGLRIMNRYECTKYESADTQKTKEQVDRVRYTEFNFF